MADKKPRKKRQKVLLPKDKQLEAEQKLAKRKAENPDVYTLPDSKRSVQDLTEYFARVEEDTNRILPKEKRRYVVYFVNLLMMRLNKCGHWKTSEQSVLSWLTGSK